MFDEVNIVQLQEIRVCLEPDTYGPCCGCLRRVETPARLVPGQHVMFPRKRIATCEDQITPV